MTTLQFRVDGVPKPKGSMRHVGNGRMVEQVEGSAPWRERVLWAARKAAQDTGWERLDGPVTVGITAWYERPKSAPKRRDWHPVTRTSGDADKVARNILDALVDAAVIRDDSQIVELHVWKCEAVNGPCAQIAVEAVTA